MKEAFIDIWKPSYNSFVGSMAPILALIAFPSKTNSLISFPVPGPFCIPQHANRSLSQLLY